MKINIYIIKVFAMAGLLAFASCDELLEEEPVSVISPDGFYNSDDRLLVGLNGIYLDLMDWDLWKQPAWISLAGESPDILGDTWIAGGLSGNMDGQWYIQRPWRGNYLVIGKANSLLDALETAVVSETMINRAKGESLFLRAYSYFDLAKRYGDVPLRLKAFNPADENAADGFGNKGRDPIEDVYAAIVQDLQDAITTFSDEVVEGRPGKIAAMGMLARVYLHMAGAELAGKNLPLSQQEYNQLAADIAGQVKSVASSIGSGSFPSLQASYMDNWEIDGQQTSTEILFMIQSSDQGLGPELHPFWVPQTDKNANPLSGGDQFGVFSLIPRFYESFEPGDRRAELGTAIIDSWIDPAGLTVYQQKVIPAGFTDDGTSAPWTDGCGDCDPPNLYGFWNYTDGTNNIKVSGRYYSRKWVDASATTKDGNRTNIPLLRYADVLLILAEAENEANGGPTSLGYEAVNEVRERAGLAPLSGLNQDAFRDAVWLERRHEFYAEFNTKFDLLRQGRWLELMNQFGRTRDPHRVLYPIHQDEINANTQINENNPGF